MKVRIPPWRWSLWGLWPPAKTDAPLIPEAQIRPLAERLSKQRPWLSAEENWLAAERALRQKPWRPWVIHFSGEKERSGWDWADLLLKVSVPVLILGLSTAYSIISSSRQEKIASEQRESDVVTGFFKEMKPLILDKDIKESATDAEARGVARGLTLAALSQVKDAQRKRLIVVFLLFSGLNTEPSKLFSLSEADLRGADLSFANLSGADLSFADLSGADLSFADLSGANLIANFSGANFDGANLTGANLIKAGLSGARLSGANLSGANLSRANLIKADLGWANLSRANLIKADLSEARLVVANLRGANLSEANLSGADLSFANLSGADLSFADLSGANLSGADLENIKWDEKTKWPSLDSLTNLKNAPTKLKAELGIK